MIKTLTTPILALAMLSFGSISTAEAKRVKEEANVSISFALQPAVGSGSTASGTATITVERDDDESQTAELELETTGLPALPEGQSYKLVGNIPSTDPAVPGEQQIDLLSFTVDAPEPGIATSEPTETETESEVDESVTLSGDIDPFAITSVAVLDPSGATVLSGSAVQTINYWYFKATVKVVAGPPVAPVDPAPTTDGKGKGKGKVKAPKVKKVHGTAVVQALVTNNVETKRKFLFVAHGAPASTLLNVNIDGATVATVTSSHNGKVMIKELDPAVSLVGISAITITNPADASGAVLMQASF